MDNWTWWSDRSDVGERSDLNKWLFTDIDDTDLFFIYNSSVNSLSFFRSGHNFDLLDVSAFGLDQFGSLSDVYLELSLNLFDDLLDLRNSLDDFLSGCWSGDYLSELIGAGFNIYFFTSLIYLNSLDKSHSFGLFIVEEYFLSSFSWRSADNCHIFLDLIEIFNSYLISFNSSSEVFSDMVHYLLDLSIFLRHHRNYLARNNSNWEDWSDVDWFSSVGNHFGSKTGDYFGLGVEHGGDLDWSLSFWCENNCAFL